LILLHFDFYLEDRNFLSPILITFSGIDGAGKSTQIEKLREYLTQQGVSVRILTFWDNVAVLSSMRSGFSRKVLQSDGKVGSPDKPANRNDKNTRSFPLLVGRSLLHLLDVSRLRKIVRRERASGSGGVIIFDRYIYDQLAALPTRVSHRFHASISQLISGVAAVCAPQSDPGW
jgi:hypothetical protein